MTTDPEFMDAMKDWLRHDDVGRTHRATIKAVEDALDANPKAWRTDTCQLEAAWKDAEEAFRRHLAANVSPLRL